ncbi:uncharacterized protein PGTG_21328 [Puccinia graminis f. sp. tritici CRL 75-36-700-3]|uniref:Uncharacterized protein n=1 Tax=Puccinia graminis f. sp. tritici (strain CRL 75-36-700-3 / race SCCL) TaxID=418459 RepID=H6QR61_PUCGT|nr:uncharacterized protein PGTG_21328 [Puccinia graminis f. sp. tritici CRL 75-36-700-3]EHS63036.1 hypothetical protein PGTG_21328 [Puccinia graminis f. sp. tritici CRL 75-36-700-3]
MHTVPVRNPPRSSIYEFLRLPECKSLCDSDVDSASSLDKRVIRRDSKVEEGTPEATELLPTGPF